MKRMLIVGLTLLLTFTLVSAAMAYQVRIGGRVSTDAVYSLRTGSSYLGWANTRDIRQPDLTTFNIQVSDGALQFLFYTDDRRTGAHLQFSFTAGPAHGATAVVLTYMYGWYSFGNCRMDIGHKDNMFAAAKYAPYGALGFQQLPGGSGGFVEFGKLYSGRFAQIGFYYNLPQWSFMVALGQAGPATANNPAWRNNQNILVFNTTLPRLDLAVEYRGRNFSVCPGLSIYLTEHDGMEGTSLQDDRVLAFALALPFRLTFGDFGLTGEVSYSRNWRTAGMINVFKGGLWWGGANDNQNRIKVADTDVYGVCLGLFYRVGRATFWLSGGWEMSQNGSSDANGTWRHGQNVRYAVVFAVPYRVNRHFTIAPEIGYYFYGWDPTQDVGGPNNPGTTADLGSAWLMGIRFTVAF